MKTKGNTPKYGLLYHSSFIGRANGKDKGKISRNLANKCAIAARLDNFLLKVDLGINLNEYWLANRQIRWEDEGISGIKIEVFDCRWSIGQEHRLNGWGNDWIEAGRIVCGFWGLITSVKKEKEVKEVACWSNRGSIY